MRETGPVPRRSESTPQAEIRPSEEFDFVHWSVVRRLAAQPISAAGLWFWVLTQWTWLSILVPTCFLRPQRPNRCDARHLSQ
jgi:hypothetical protein